MERREYLARLDRALRELTGSRERQDILAYYREYLEEAGSEGETEAMDALGAPEVLALRSVEPVPETPPLPRRRPVPRPVPEDACRSPAALLGLRFEAVRLDVDGVQVRLEAGEAFLVRLDGEALACSVQDGVLRVSGSGEAGSLVSITVPQGERLEEVRLRTRGGDVLVGAVEIGRLSVDAGAGSVELRGTRAGALDLRSRTGISTPGSRVPQRLRGRAAPRRRQTNRREHVLMKTNVFLRSTRRQPVRALFLALVTAFVTFAFVGRASEYLLIKQETERLGSWYRTVGELEPSEEGAAADLEGAAAYLAESGYVQTVDRVRATSTVMAEALNGTLNGEGAGACREMFFYGTLNYASALPNGVYRFYFDVDTVLAGHSEFVQAGNRSVMVNTLDINGGGNADFARVYEELEPERRYLMRGYYLPYYFPGNDDNPIQVQPLTEDGPWFIPVAEGEALDLSLPEYVGVGAEVQRVWDNVHAVCAIATEDMSALPETQEVSQDLYLASGRWLDASDSAAGNRACVIPQELADTRHLAVGDVLTLTLRDMESAYTSGPYVLDVDAAPPEADAEPYEIVGIYGLTNPSAEPYTDSRDIYIPASAIPSSFTHAELEENVSYVLTSPTVEWDFLDEAKEALAPLGLRPVLLDNGWHDFQAAAKPMRRSALFNALIYSLVLAASLCLVDFLYFFMRRRELAITRALGLPAKVCMRQASLPLLILGVSGVFAGGALGWWWTLHTAADTLQALSTFGGRTDAALSGLWLVLLLGIVLLMLGVLTLGSASRLAGRPILAQVQGGGSAGRKREKRSAAVPASSSAPAASALSLSAIALSQPLPRSTKGAAYMVRFAWRHVVRAKMKSVLAVLLAAVFTAALGAIHLAILTSEEQLDTLYETTVVEMELVRSESIQYGRFTGYIQGEVVDRILDTGFVSDCYLEGASSGAILLDPPELEEGQPLSIQAESVNASIRSLDDPMEFFGGVGSGGELSVTYFDGWDADLFAKSWAGSEELGPVVLPRALLEACGLETGESVGVVTKGSYTVCQVAGFYDGEAGGASDGFPILLPTSVWEALSKDNLVYNRAHFTLDTAQNRNLPEFRAAAEEIMADVPAGLAKLRTVLWDEELRQAVEPLEDSIALMKLLYPVVIVLSVLVAAGVPVLFVMLSAKEAAILRVQGTSRPRTVVMLLLQQFLPSILGLAAGLAGILISVSGARPPLLPDIAPGAALCAGLYLLSAIAGAVSAAILVTAKNPLEMLQVRE